MSIVSKYVTPAVVGIPAAVTLFRSRPPGTDLATFVKGSVALSASVVLQLFVVRRSAMGGKPSNVHGVVALFYPLILVLLLLMTFMLYNKLPPALLLQFLIGGGGPRRLGASGNHPVYQYRLNDVIDRVREIVGDRMKSGSGDVVER